MLFIKNVWRRLIEIRDGRRIKRQTLYVTSYCEKRWPH